MADTRFRVRQMNRDDVPFGKGQCDIRLQVDNEVEVAVQRDVVSIHTISGQEARDDGSECNQPLPDRDLRGFQFEVKDSRNDIRLVSEPSRRNDFTAIVRIRDGAGGFGRYHFRLSWEITGSIGPEPRRDRPDGAFAWNNAMSFRDPGRGSAVFNGADVRRIFDATVDIDRGGRIVVSFRTDRGRPLVFTGTMMRPEGRGLKADVVSEDRRLHGPMFLTVDERRVLSISLEATNGRDRLRVNWDRR